MCSYKNWSGKTEVKMNKNKHPAYYSCSLILPASKFPMVVCLMQNGC